MPNSTESVKQIIQTEITQTKIGNYLYLRIYIKAILKICTSLKVHTKLQVGHPLSEMLLALHLGISALYLPMCIPKSKI